MSIRFVRSVILGICVTLALSSGFYLGLTSCGNYYWHWQLQDLLELITSTAWIIATALVYRDTPKSIRHLWRTVITCILFFFGIHILFFTTMASVGPFYPAPPESFAEWWRGFVFTWKEGVPC